MPAHHTPSLALLLLVALAGVLPVSAGAQENAEAFEEATYSIRPGDRVEVAFFSQTGEALPQVAGEKLVNRSGRIYLPLVGAVDVAGMDTEALRETLEDRFQAFFDEPVIDVAVGLRVNLTGAVRNPGNYYLPPSATVVDALAYGGGTITELDLGGGQGAADAGRVQVVRNGATTVVDLRPDRVTQETVNMQIQSGDWIHVPRRTRSVWRENMQFISNVVSLVGSVTALVILLN